MGTHRRLLLCLGSLLVFFICIRAQASEQQQQQLTTDDEWDDVDQHYEELDFDNIDTDVQQEAEEDDEDIEQQSDADSQRVKILTSPAPVFRSQNPYHNLRVCTTFGNYHFKTFDGDIFHFPGLCNYHFVRHCQTNYEDFNIQVRRTLRKTVPVISTINMKIEGIDIILAEKSVMVNDEFVQKLPFTMGGMQISKSGSYMRVYSKIGIDLMWNEEDSLTLELSQKYANQTCGLCGDYNGIPIYNEFIVNNAQLSHRQFGNLHKFNAPEERCEDTKEEEIKKCNSTIQHKQFCANVLNGNGLKDCHDIVDVQKYIEICEQDFCRCQGNLTGFCVCNVFTEYSRQCTHAGGKPKKWRTATICPLKCAYNLQFKECGTSCPDTCTNPERSRVCDDHCTDGCFCPAGTVFDDITKTGCIAKEKCACTYNGDVYPTGTGYSEKCQDCTCQGGKWVCVKKACFGTCSLEGGSHISTFDLTRYNFHGDCIYTLAKSCDSTLFSVLVEMDKCGYTDTETCLKSISLSLNGGREFILVKKCGSVYVNSIYTQLPMISGTITIYKPTSFYIIMHTNFGLQIKIQLVPIMQVYVIVDPKFMNQTCGLCGNFNNIQADDFKSVSGVIEGTGSSFGNLWKNQLDCPNIKNNFEDPCALIGQNEKYASHWCDMMLAPDGPFASCHKTVNPDDFHKNCMFDSCNSENKEHSMCAALSSYVYACSREGVDLRGWRTDVCHSYMTTCSPGFVYRYKVSTCPLTCRSLSESDKICEIDYVPIDGCTCADGTYLDEAGDCVLPALCSCYYKGTAVSPGEVIHDSGSVCTCTNGKMECIGVNPVEEKVCKEPMVYFDCDSASAEAKQTVCQKSCATIDNECYSSQCVSGCVCPEGLVYDDGKEECVPEDQCPCRLNDDIYSAGETVKVKCNTCTCKNRKWDCTQNTCLSTCATYGDGHYLTFDNKRFRFNGDCWYTLAQDYCSDNASLGTFRVVTENVPCGSKGVTCSKSIRLYLGNYELILKDQKFEVIKKDYGQYVYFKVRQMGIYLVVEAANRMVLVWDKRNTILIKLDPKFEGKTCGLCGNYDGNAANDYITRSQSVVGDVLEFGNSWKLSQRCPNAVEIPDTCDSNPYRKAWSQKQCSIITSATFSSCHSLVNPTQYYEACVNDACACDTGGDCDCLCTAVSAYAQACSEAGQCISWRTPNICPVFCDFYNRQGHCEWHYKACGAPCMKTCMNPSGVCMNNLVGLEGCYPKCPEDRPYFDEESMQCVASCHCYDDYGDEYKPGEKMPSESRCSICKCTKNGKECNQAKACCHYQGKEFLPGDIVYHTADGTGGCIYATCSDNSTVERTIENCPTTTIPPTTFDFTTPAFSSEWQPTTSTGYESPSTSPTPTKPTSSGSTSSESPSSATVGSVTPVSPTTCVEAYDCTWSQWYDVSKPENGDGDMERFVDIESQGYEVCKKPKDVQCRAKEFPQQSLDDIGQDFECNKNSGFVCLNSKNPPMCHNYEIRIECCKYRPCITISSTTSSEESIPPPETSSPPELITQSPTSKETPPSLPSELTSEPGTSESPSTPTTISTPPNTSSSPGIETENTQKTPASSETIPKTTIVSPTTTCVYKMECRWTSWYDTNTPSTRSDGGESETVKDITSKGYQVCRDQEVENKIECEAVDDNGITIADNNQKVTCDLKSGLNCQNREQIKKEKCFNYRIRIECCEEHCEPIPTPDIHTTETTKQSNTEGEYTTKGTTTSSPTESSQPDSSKSPSSTPSTSTLSTERPVPGTSIPTTSYEVTPSETTVCVNKMTCRWTPWYDYNTPNTRSDGGETESVDGIKSKGIEICTDREIEDKIECEAIDNKGASVADNNQKVSCNVKDGLICKNRDQLKKEKCFNYRIRILCCKEYCEPLATPKITTTETSEPKTTAGETTITTTTSETGPPKLPSTGFPSTKKPGPETSSPSESTSPPSTSSSSSEVTTSVSPTTCVHKMECRWTPWYDINRPTLQNDGGDSETPEDIKSKGYEICKEEREVENKIECEAIDHEGVTIANNQQILTCVLGNGLTCRNSDQKKKNEKCHNYRIRVECCAAYCEPVLTTSTPLATQSSVPSSATTVQTTTSSVTEPSSTSEDCEKFRSSECKWTEWFNQNKPSEDIDGEDNENSNNLRAKGIEVCKQGEIENQIQCKAEQYSELTNENTEQKSTCNVKEGLICKNKDQPGKKCNDYSIRIECCSEKFVKFCGVTTTPSSTEKTSIPTTTSITKPSSSEPTSVTKTPSTSLPSSPSSSEITSQPTTVCIKKKECRWTSWYDTNVPNTKSNGGDIENYEDITSKGYEICIDGEVENKIECEAIDKNGETIVDNKQKMTCDLETGLTCFNRQQKNKEKCYNYRIRIECCAERCEKLETPTTVGTSTTASTSTLSEPTSTEKSTSFPTSTPSSSTTSVTEPGSPTPEDCDNFRKAECYWTDWFNKETPTSDMDGGDHENTSKLKTGGIDICTDDEIENQIQCRAEKYPDLAFESTGKKLTCNVKEGLICKNKDQPEEKCNDYSIRIECCSKKFVKLCGETITPTTTSATSIPTTTSVSSTGSSTPSQPSSSTDETYTKSPTQTTSIISSPTTTSSTTKIESTSSPPSTMTSCDKFRQKECRWTEWYNTQTPSSDINGEDKENSNELRSRGIEVCKNEEVENEIECKAEKYSLKESNQVRTCNVKDGLICKNKEQTAEPKECLDYSVRFECCSKKFIESCGKSTPFPTSPSSSEVTKSPLTTSVTEISSPGSTSTTGENVTPSTQTSGETSTPGKPTGGESSTPGRPTGGESSTPGTPTGSESSTPGRPTGGESSTPGRPTEGESSTPGPATSGETSTPGRPTGGESSTPGKPTGGETSTPGTPTGGETSTPGKPTGGETSTPGRPTGGESSTPGRPTGGENSTPGTPTGGETSTPGTPTGGETSTPGRPTGGETSTPGTPTGGETSTPGRPTGGETSTPGRPTGGESSTPGTPTSSESSTPGRPTGGESSTPGTPPSGETSTPGRPTEGETPTPGPATGGETSTPGSPTGGESSTPGKPTGGETSTPGPATGGETSTPGSPTGGESSTPGKPTGGETSTPGTPTGGETSTPGRPTGGETSTPGRPTGGESSTPGTPTSSESSTPGRPTGGESSTPGTPPSNETSTPGRPTEGETPTPGPATGGETSTPGSPTGGESSTPGKPTGGETSTPGTPTGGETSTPGRPTGGETSTPGRPTGGETSTPGRPTGGESSTPGTPTSSVSSTPGRPISGESSTPGTPPSGETSTPGRPTEGETSTPGPATGGETSTPGRPTGGESSTPGKPTGGETSTPGTPTGGETSTPGRPTGGETSTPGRPTGGESSTPGTPTSSESSTPGKPTGGESSTPGTPTNGETSTPGRPTGGETSTPGRPTTGESSTPGKPTGGETSTPGTPTGGETSTPGTPTGGETSTPGRPTGGESSTPGTPTGSESSTPGRPTGGETSTQLTPGSSQPSSTTPPSSCKILREGECRWTVWYNTNKPSPDINGEEKENSDQLRSNGIDVCKEDEVEYDIECTAEKYSDLSEKDSNQVLTCNVKDGLVCKNKEQKGEPKCLDYAVRYECCSKRYIESCGEIGTPPTSTSSSEVTPGTPPSGETSTPGRPTEGETSTPGPATGGETSTPGRPTGGESSTPGKPTGGETSTPGTPTGGETSTPGTPTGGETSTPGRPTGGESSTPGTPTSSESSTPGKPTGGESSTPGTPTNGETSTPGRPTGGETSTPGRPTTGESSTPGKPTGGETSTPGTPTGGETSTPGRPTGGESSTPGTPTGSESSTPGRPTGGETSTQLTPGSSQPSSTTPPSSCKILRESECRWTVWYNTNKPSPDINGEEKENSDQLRSNGIDVCKEDEVEYDIECTAEKYSDLSEKDSNQVLTCNVKDGLVCKNKEQKGEPKCLDYAVRYECCSKRYIESCGEIGTTPTSTSSSEVTPGTPPSGGTSTPGRPTEGETSTPGPATGGETSTPGRPTGGESSTPGKPTGGETSTPGTPTGGETSTPGTPTGGETSTPGRPTGGESSTPGTPTSSESSTPGKPTGGESSTPGTPTNGETSTPGRPTGGETSTPGRPSTGESSTPGSPTGGETSTPGTPTGGETSTPGTSTGGEPSTPGRPTGGESSTPGTPTGSESSTPGRPTGGETSTQLTPGSSQPSSTTPPSSCKILRESECRWTIWYNTNKPSPDINGEEKENSDQLRSNGIDVCKENEVEYDIECTAEKYSDLSEKDSYQVLTCNVKDGLVCKNKEQKGEPKCLDYAVRYECCSKRYIESCGEIGTPPTSTSSSEVTPGTTPSETSPGATTSVTGSSPLSTSSSISGTTTNTVTVTSTSGTTASPIGSSSQTTSSTSVTSSTEILATTSGPEITTPSSTISPTVTPSTTTIVCFCKIKDDMYAQGETIYQKQDMDGCVYTATCNKKCEIERSVGECSTPGTTPTTTTLTSEEITRILDLTSGKPSKTRPSRRPPTKPHTGQPGENSTSAEPSTSTETTDSADLYNGFIDKIPLDQQPKQEVLRSYNLEGLGGTHETEDCGPCECLMPTCGTGYRVVSYMPPGACCATVTCEPDSVCVVDNTIYQRGSTIPQPKDVCLNCECAKDEKDESGFYAVKCQPLQCDTTCEEGYAYAAKEGECCGECVPKQCIIKGVKGEKGEKEEQGEQGDDDKPVKIKIGESYRPEGSTCSYYECSEEDDKPVLTKVKKVCQELDISKCEKDTIKYDEDGCCQTCTLKTEVTIIEKPVVENCSSRKNVTVFKEDDCEIEVELTYCGGPCMGKSIYSMESQGMDHQCSCCTELEVAERQVELLCANGQRRVHYYKDVVRCGCSVASCEPLTSAEIQQTDQQQKTQTAFNYRRR